MRLTSYSERRSEQAVDVIVVLATILMLYIAANVRSLRLLSQEIKLVEKRQLRHWNRGAATTIATVQSAILARELTLP